MTEKTQKERLLESLAKKKTLDAEHTALCKEILAEIEGDKDDESLNRDQPDGSYSTENGVLKMKLQDGAEGFSPFIEYPITVTDIVDKARDLWSKGWRHKQNQLVAIRPCGEQYEGKTYLGVYIGDVALRCTVSYHRKSGVLDYGPTGHNPAIYVPDLEKIIFGCESWWGAIKCEDDLKAITNDDINSVWYVQAGKQIGIEPVLSKTYRLSEGEIEELREILGYADVTEVFTDLIIEAVRKESDHGQEETKDD